MSGFVSLFLFVDGGARLARFAPYVDGMTRFGYAADLAPWVGLTLLFCTVLYVVPRTAILGAILVTGYLGGATASQVRVGDPWFLFPAALGVMAWGGLWLRYAVLRDLIPAMKR
ncbi:MAG: DoxX family protein [Gemmatimonadales bacterium]